MIIRMMSMFVLSNQMAEKCENQFWFGFVERLRCSSIVRWMYVMNASKSVKGLKKTNHNFRKKQNTKLKPSLKIPYTECTDLLKGS